MCKFKLLTVPHAQNLAETFKGQERTGAQTSILVGAIEGVQFLWWSRRAEGIVHHVSTPQELDQSFRQSAPFPSEDEDLFAWGSLSAKTDECSEHHGCCIVRIWQSSFAQQIAFWIARNLCERISIGAGATRHARCKTAQRLLKNICWTTFRCVDSLLQQRGQKNIKMNSLNDRVVDFDVGQSLLIPSKDPKWTLRDGALGWKAAATDEAQTQVQMRKRAGRTVSVLLILWWYNWDRTVWSDLLQWHTIFSRPIIVIQSSARHQSWVKQTHVRFLSLKHRCPAVWGTLIYLRKVPVLLCGVSDFDNIFLGAKSVAFDISPISLFGPELPVDVKRREWGVQKLGKGCTR